MENQIQRMFDYNGSQVRTVVIDGEPWFVLNDVCEILEIMNPRNIAARLNGRMKDAVRIMDTIGRMQEMTVISEAGVYKLVFQSRKPEAEKFTDWIAEKVLPAIRQKGSYTAQPKSQLEIMLNQNETIQELLVKMIQKEQEDQARDRLLAEVRQEASFAHQRINTLDMIEPQGNLRQQLNDKVKKYRLAKGISYTLAWHIFVSAYNNAYNTNLELSMTHHYKKMGKRMTRPEFLELKGLLNEAHRVIDKLLYEGAA